MLNIALALGIQEENTEKYIVIDKIRLTGCAWEDVPSPTGSGRWEHNCIAPKVGIHIQHAIVKFGSTDDLNSGRDTIYPIP